MKKITLLIMGTATLWLSGCLRIEVHRGPDGSRREVAIEPFLRFVTEEDHRERPQLAPPGSRGPGRQQMREAEERLAQQSERLRRRAEELANENEALRDRLEQLERELAEMREQRQRRR